jgi:hypothetical protein
MQQIYKKKIIFTSLLDKVDVNKVKDINQNNTVN